MIGDRRHLILGVTLSSVETAVAQRLRCCATNRKVAGSIPAGVSGFFIDTKSFQSHYGLGVNSASNRNEYQEYFVGVKAAVRRCVRLTTYHHPVPFSRNLGTLTSWNPLGPSGPVTVLIYLFIVICGLFRLYHNFPHHLTKARLSQKKMLLYIKCVYNFCPKHFSF